MSTYVTTEGLQIPTIEEMLSRLSAEQRAEIDALLDTEAESPAGQINGIVVSHFREAWEALQESFHGMDPDQAEASLLDFLCALTGTRRSKGTPSRFLGTRKLVLSLDANATVPKGSVASISGNPLIRFKLTEEVKSTIAGDYLGAAECEKTGPIACNSGTLTVIATPVVGWSAVNNPFDAILGRNQDNDPQLRLRREQELRATGSTNEESLRADLLAFESEDGTKPVLDCRVFNNDDDFPSTEGLPPHSMEALVFDGLGLDVPNDTLAQIIWDGKPGGIQMIGNTSGVATDSTGAKHTVRFSRPTVKDIAFSLHLQVDPDTYAGDPAIKDLMVGVFKKKIAQGTVIKCNDYVGPLMAETGVTDVLGIQITFNGSGFPAIGLNLHLGLRQMGNTQSSFITVVTV